MLNSILKLMHWFHLRLYVCCFQILAELILVCLHCAMTVGWALFSKVYFAHLIILKISFC